MQQSKLNDIAASMIDICVTFLIEFRYWKNKNHIPCLINLVLSYYLWIIAFSFFSVNVSSIVCNIILKIDIPVVKNNPSLFPFALFGRQYFTDNQSFTMYAFFWILYDSQRQISCRKTLTRSVIREWRQINIQIIGSKLRNVTCRKKVKYEMILNVILRTRQKKQLRWQFCIFVQLKWACYFFSFWIFLTNVNIFLSVRSRKWTCHCGRSWYTFLQIIHSLHNVWYRVSFCVN